MSEQKRTRTSPGFCLRNAFYAGGHKVDAPEWTTASELKSICDENEFDYIVGVSGSMTEIIGERSGVYIYRCSEFDAHAVFFKHRTEIDTAMDLLALILF